MLRAVSVSTALPEAIDAREMLARLVGFPTVSSRSNLDLVDFAEDHLKACGAETRRLPDPSGTKAGLLARIGPPEPGGVVLSGHTDVVPVEGQDWSSDPFTLTARDGRLYGRGTCDMKGFCATALALAPEMAAAGLRRPILIALSRDEEIGCLGAEDVVAALGSGAGPPAAVIVGEPSDMRVVSGHKGSWGFAIRLRGHEVHSSLIHTGVSAVMEGARLVDWMRSCTAENAARATPSDFVPPYTTLHVGTISGGTASNITARDCVLTGEVRVLPGEDAADWKARIEAHVAKQAAEMRAIHPDAGIIVESRMTIPALTPETNGQAEELARKLTGDNGAHVVSYQTEAGAFQAAGLSTVVCGPGSIEQAHQPDEYITEDQLAASTAFLRRLIGHLAA